MYCKICRKANGLSKESQGRNIQNTALVGSISTLIYTSELMLFSTICVHSATQRNIHMYPYFLFAVIHHLNRPRLPSFLAS